jgi:hypothetical protein
MLVAAFVLPATPRAARADADVAEDSEERGAELTLEPV